MQRLQSMLPAEIKRPPLDLSLAQALDPSVEGTEERREHEAYEQFPTKALADRQTDPVPDTERLAQPVVCHQDRRHK